MASEARLQEGIEPGDSHRLAKMSRVHMDVRDLNLRVMDGLLRNGISPFSIPPWAVASFSSAQVKSFDSKPFQFLLEREIVPVSFGDIVPDDEMGFSICSGDLIMVALARHFRPERAIFVADVDGIYDSDPKTNREAKLIDTLTKDVAKGVSGETAGGDVTGSMAGKMSRMLEIARHCENCIILNGNAAGRLERALKGEKTISTRVIA